MSYELGVVDVECVENILVLDFLQIPLQAKYQTQSVVPFFPQLKHIFEMFYLLCAGEKETIIG